MDLDGFLLYLQNNNIRYLKDYFINKQTRKRYKVVIESLKIILSDYDSLEEGYKVFKISDLEEVKQYILKCFEKSYCPICGKFVKVIEIHLKSAYECNKKYKEYQKILRDFVIKEKEVSERALIPLVYNGIK